MKNYPKKNYSLKPPTPLTNQQKLKGLLFSTKDTPIAPISKKAFLSKDSKEEKEVSLKDSFSFSKMKMERIPYFLMINLLYASELNGPDWEKTSLRKTYQLFKEVLRKEKAPVRWKISFKEIAETCFLIIQEKNRLDEEIEKKLLNWEMTNLQLIKKAILRWGVFFLTQENSLEKKKVIPYAIYFAKCLGEKKDYKFINGILDSFSK